MSYTFHFSNENKNFIIDDDSYINRNEIKLDNKNDWNNLTPNLSMIACNINTCKTNKSGDVTTTEMANNYVNYVYNTENEEEKSHDNFNIRNNLNNLEIKNNQNNQVKFNKNIVKQNFNSNQDEIFSNILFSGEITNIIPNNNVDMKLKRDSDSIIINPDYNLLSSCNFSFEKFIRKSNSVKSILDLKNQIIKQNPTKELKIHNHNFIQEKKLERNFSTFKRTHTKNKSVQLYLDKRHLEEVEKLNLMRFEKLEKENEEIRDRPLISSKSKKIIDAKLTNTKSVFERLSDKSQFKKKNEDIKIMEDLYKKEIYTHEPKINKISKLFQRDINDLYNWQIRKDERIELEREEKIRKEMESKGIDKISQYILRENNPRYLEMKVEDRLLEKARKTKSKIEERKHELYNQSKKVNLIATVHKNNNINTPRQFVKDFNLTESPKKIKHNEVRIPESARLIQTFNPKLNSDISNRKRNNSKSNIPMTSRNSKSPIPKSIHHNNIKNNVKNIFPNKDEKILDVRKQLHNYLNQNCFKNNYNTNNFNNFNKESSNTPFTNNTPIITFQNTFNERPSPSSLKEKENLKLIRQIYSYNNKNK